MAISQARCFKILSRALSRLLCLLCLVFVLQACGGEQDSPETQIREVLKLMEQANCRWQPPDENRI